MKNSKICIEIKCIFFSFFYKQTLDRMSCIHKFKIYYTKDRNITSVLSLFPCGYIVCLEY